MAVPGVGRPAGPDATPAVGVLDAFLPRRDGRYLTAVAVSGLVTAVVLVAAAPTPALWPALVGFAGFAGLIGAGDLVTRRIPNVLNLTAGLSAVPLLLIARTGGGGSMGTALLGAVAAFGVYLGLWLAAPSGMGPGDVKLAPYLGACLGFFGATPWWHGLVYGLLVQGLVAGAGLLTGHLRRGDHLAHGPAMCAGAALALLEALRLA